MIAKSLVGGVALPVSRPVRDAVRLRWEAAMRVPVGSRATRRKHSQTGVDSWREQPYRPTIRYTGPGNTLVGNRSWLIAKDLPIPVENRPSHRQFSGEVPPGAYSNACPVRGRPPCRAIANARVLIPRAQGGSGGTRKDQA